jgi:hypothetical protein
MISFLRTISASPVTSIYRQVKPSKSPTSSVSTGPKEGQAVKCGSGGNGKGDAVYRYTGGRLSWYPNPDIAKSWDSTWTTFIQVDCTQIPVSTPMIKAPQEGQAVKCISGGNGNSGSVYRFTKNQVRWYQNPNTWDSNWGSFIKIDCTNIVLGPNMSPK